MLSASQSLYGGLSRDHQRSKGVSVHVLRRSTAPDLGAGGRRPHEILPRSPGAVEELRSDYRAEECTSEIEMT